MSQKDRPPQQTLGRLSLEPLEAREVPANYVWAPPAGMLGMPPPPPPSFTTLTNWRVGVGPTDFATELPNGDDHLFFIGGISSANCTIPDQTPTAPTNAFAGIHLNFGLEAVPTEIGSPPPPPTNVPYSGTVTVADSLAVGDLDVDCGAIAQADPNAPTGTAGTLTVNGHLDWTGGTLNSNTTAGTIALAPGATGVAEPSFTNPGINGTVTLGSQLALLGSETTQTGSSLLNYEGTYTLKNNANIVVQGHSSFLIKAPAPTATHTDARIIYNADPVTHWAVDKGLVETDGGTVEIECAEQPRTTNLPARVQFNAKVPKLLNKDGTVVIRDKTEVMFHPTEGDGEGGGIRHDGFHDPVTRIEAGCKVIGEQNTGVRIDCGALELTALMNGEGQPVATQPEIVISATAADYALDLPGGSARIRRPGDRTVTLDLKVEGTFRALGVMEFWADRTRGDSDRILVSKKVEMDEFSRVDVQWLESTAASAAAPTEWELVRVTSQAAGDKIANEGLPRFDPPFPAGDFVPTLAITDGDKKLIMERKL